jgi:hypothetical protein
MKRRQLLQNLTVVTAGVILLQNCITDPKKVSIALRNLKITAEEEDLLASLADTLIPPSDTPGALAVGAHLFTLVMVDDCHSAEEQDKFLKGMRSFNDVCKNLSGKKFRNANSEVRLEILKVLEEKRQTLTDETKTFYEGSKYYIIEGYRASEHFLTNVKPYKLVPGPVFKGCVPASTPTA